MYVFFFNYSAQNIVLNVLKKISTQFHQLKVEYIVEKIHIKNVMFKK